MAVIDTPSETVAAAPEETTAPRPTPAGIAGALGSGDHKVIGRFYIGTALIFTALGLALGALFGVERVAPDTLSIFGAETVFQFWVLERLGLVFLVALPLMVGVGMAVVPLQVGSRAIAFPRAAAASYWGWLFGSLLFVASFAINGGPGGGSQTGVTLWIASLGLIIVSVLLAAVCIATTVLTLRQTGMTTNDVPMFSWSMLVASVLWLLTLPVAIAQLALVYIDYRLGGGNTIGANAEMFGNFTWLIENPQAYVVAIPVLGFAVDVLATTAGVRIAPRSAAAGAIGAFGVFSFGAFLAGSSAHDHKAWIVVALGLAAVLPVLAILGLVGDLFRRGSFRINAGALYAIGALLILLLTVLAGALASIPALETYGTVIQLAVSKGAVLAAVTAALGGIHWWATKLGRNAALETAGRLTPVLFLAGAVLVIAPEVASGLLGKDGTNEVVPSWAGGLPALNAAVAVGFVLALVGLLVAVATHKPLGSRELSRDSDPWDGQTLEWLAPSPPPLDNFVEPLPVVTSGEPLIDLREEK